MMGPGVTNYITSFAAAVGAGGAGEREDGCLSRAVMGRDSFFFFFFLICVLCLQTDTSRNKRCTDTQNFTYMKKTHTCRLGFIRTKTHTYNKILNLHKSIILFSSSSPLEALFE